MIYGIWIGSDSRLQHVTGECYIIYNLTTPLSFSRFFLCSLPAVDPMGEEHYARRASWIPPFMVVVGLVCFLYILYMLSICLCVS